jgi:signal transduction histidine kinase
LLKAVLGMIFGLCLGAGPACATEQEARVLILNGLDPYLPAYMAIDGAMRASLAKETTKRIVLYSEPLDAQRFAGESLEPEVLALLAKKYRTLKIDVVVTVMRPALDFYQRHGEALWPGARVVFHGIPDLAIEPTTLPSNATGQVNRDDFEGTIELARRLQPNARRILVIGGASPLDLELERRARQVVPTIAGAPAVEFLTGLPLPELVARVGTEPADTIVLYLTQFRDRDARPYLPREVLRAISNASAAPVYGLFETYVGSGVAAGNMEFYEDRGRLVGQLVREAVAGKPPAPGNAVFTVPSRCVADARALQRWSLDEARLPNGCDIRFADSPPWRQYLWQISVALAILVGQTLLIVALFMQRRRRRQAEAESQVRAEQAAKARVETGQYRENLAHVVRVHTAGEMSAALAHEITQPLGAIENYALAARRRLGEDSPDLARVGDLLEKVIGQATRAGDVVTRMRGMVQRHELEPKEIDVGRAVRECVDMVKMECELRDIRIELESAGALPAVVADEIHLQQVILNLLRNAMEAVEAPHPNVARQIAIGILREGSDAVSVQVADRGPGIAEGDLERVFESFYSTKPSGLGIGLAICRKLIEAHGGALWASHNPGGGAVFRFTLPVAGSVN